MTILAAEGMAVCDHPWLASVQRIGRAIEPALVTGSLDRELLHVLVSDAERLSFHAAVHGQKPTPVPKLTLFEEAA